MANRMTIDELKSYLWDSAVLLRTNIDAGAYKQYIFPLLFFKRICTFTMKKPKLLNRNMVTTSICIPKRSFIPSWCPRDTIGTMFASSPKMLVSQS